MEVSRPELRLLLASARTVGADEPTIRAILERGIDWTYVARRATQHGVAGVCGWTLNRLAPDLIPEELLDAFRISIERARTRNQAALHEIVELTEALAKSGIDAVALKGPVLATQAYPDPGLREPGRCDLLVQKSQAAAAQAMVRAAEKAGVVGTQVCTELKARETTLDIDYAQLRQRAMRTKLNGQILMTLAPEDGVLALAIHGSDGAWWRIKRACDLTAFIGAHPELDWDATLTRARAAGCVPLLALGLSLARGYLGSKLPQTLAEHITPDIESLAERIAGHWGADGAPRPAESLAEDVRRLHSGPVRRARRLVRTILSARGRAPAPDADRPDPLQSARALFDSKRFGEAVEAVDQILSGDPTNVEAQHLGVFARLKACDWRRLEQDKAWLIQRARTHPQVIWPSLPQLFYFERNSELERLAIEQIPASGHVRLPEPMWRGERYRHPEIRIAYLSAGLSSDPMAALATGIFEHHDKARFDVTAISLGRDVRTPMRRRIEVASGRFIQADKMSNVEVAATLRDLDVDIAVDLNGYTGKRNAAILAFRPAPVQVNLGYPGTMALPYVDYIMADRVVIPEEHASRFGENVVYLPHSFQPNDRNRPTPQETPTRAEAGLPEGGFVFASLNNPYKITPTFYDVWMRLLHAVEGSVLWLLEDNGSATENLQREAALRGIDPARVIFAPRVMPGLNVARQRLADLFLDTLPMNAQATGSDALWAGLPIVTCNGEIFRSRVAASLLHAVGLPELVTASLEKYEALALALARDPARLSAIKAKLLRNRDTAPLFDTPRYTGALEAAYTVMWQRLRQGLPPVAFAVDAQTAHEPALASAE